MATIQDYVEKKDFPWSNLDPISALDQAISGIDHLHSLDIG